jgi:GNAT superfamily N-acetyltransferase
MKVKIREYRDTDYETCRSLWVELTDRHRQIYGDPTIGGDDPGQGFDNYLAKPDRRFTWVAEIEGTGVGMTGLFVKSEEGTVEPAVVAEGFRSQGLGRMLVSRAVSEARQKGLRFLSAQPVARNIEAISFLGKMGFDILGQLELFQDLQPERGREWKSGVTIHKNKLRY